MSKLIIMLMMIFCMSSALSQSSVDVAIPEINEFFENTGIKKQLNLEAISEQEVDENLDNIKSLIEDLMAIDYSSEEKSLGFIVKEQEETLKYTLNLLSKAVTLEQKVQAFYVSKRILYTVLSLQKDPTILSTKEKIKLILKNLTIQSPYKNSKDRNQVISREDQKKEASFLYNNKGQLVMTREMLKLTYDEVSDLDISKEHPVWNRKGEESSWEGIERWAQRQMKKSTKDKDYSLKKARKVLFLKKIKTSATSPKVKAEDIYGERWKVKWGSEVHAEAIANRLYVKLGGKFADLVYSADYGKKGTILILEDPRKGDDCHNISTTATFKKCFLASNYNFDITKFIVQSGKLDDKYISGVITNLPQTKKVKKSLVGRENIEREYVLFNESLVEFQSGKAIKRSGAAASSSLGASHDRTVRGLALFNTWIKNVDIKDFNNKGVLLKQFQDGEDVFVEYQHDLGASLGFLNLPASANDLGLGKKFIKYTLGKNRIKVKEARLYSPVAWKSVTFADSLWMAKKITALRREDINKIVSSTKWPMFMQKAMAYKLLKRRERIATIFEIENLLPDRVDTPSYAVDLSTPTKRLAAAQEFNISINELNKVLKQANPEFKQDSIIDYIDHPLQNGEVSMCYESVIVNVIESTSHPSGLSRRLDRDEDNLPLKECFIGEKSFKESAMEVLKRIISFI